MSPFLGMIGCRVAGLRPINSLKKSGAAPRKALLPPEGERTCGCWVAHSAVLATCVACGRDVNSKTLILGRRTFLIAPSNLQTFFCGTSWGFTLHSVGE